MYNQQQDRSGFRNRRPRVNIPINEHIRARVLRVIDQDGNNLGEMSKESALKLAQEAELDLFVVSDKTDVPIARIVDYGKYKFQQSKKEKTGKKKQNNETKEIKMSYNIDIGDYNTRVNQSIKFLEKDKRVKLNITLRGREIQHVDLAKSLAARFIDDMIEYGTADGGPDKMMGRSVIIYINPGADKAKIKKKQQELKLLEEQENAKNSSELQNP